MGKNKKLRYLSLMGMEADMMVRVICRGRVNKRIL
jgi:hypothetical protein